MWGDTFIVEGCISKRQGFGLMLNPSIVFTFFLREALVISILIFVVVFLTCVFLLFLKCYPSLNLLLIHLEFPPSFLQRLFHVGFELESGECGVFWTLNEPDFFNFIFNLLLNILFEKGWLGAVEAKYLLGRWHFMRMLFLVVSFYHLHIFINCLLLPHYNVIHSQTQSYPHQPIGSAHPRNKPITGQAWIV